VQLHGKFLPAPLRRAHEGLLVLKLSDLQILSQHWHAIWEKLPSFLPIRRLRELDWSRNPLPGENTEHFVDYFFRSSIHFLGLDRIYRVSSAAELTQLMVRLSGSTLWGLSIGGSQQCNFSGNFKALLQALRVLPGLNILHLTGSE
jgi:hypothetical protein